MRNLARAVTAAVAAAAMVACGGGSGAGGGGGAGGGKITGRVVKGAVSNATVTAYKVDEAGKRGAALAGATSGPDGAFEIAIPAYNGALEVGATGGIYTEEALRTPVQLNRELKALLGTYQAGSTVTVTVTPVSTMAAALARYHIDHGTAVATAVSDAWTHVNQHFGNVDWRTIVPADLSSPSVTTLSPEAVAGLVLAGFSQQAKVLSQAGGITPGTIVNGATMGDSAAQDAADGTLDGIGPSGALLQAGQLLDGQTFRRGLGQAMLLYLGTPQNSSHITAGDATMLASNIAANSDPYLFCPNQVSVPACAGSSIDLAGPAVTYAAPAANSGVTGSAVAIDVAATDASDIISLRFLAPAALLAVSPTLAGTSAEIHAALDVSAIADGPLTITVEAEDAFHNKTTKDLSVVVANHGPTISVSSPMDGAAISGSMTIAATAMPQTPGAVVTSLSMVSPPPGVGGDVLPAADSFSASWDTTQALEGSLTLRFKAVDSYGSTTEKTVSVIVDNVPFGKVSVALSGGAPIAGASLKVVAVDPVTGATNASVGTGGVLGQGGPTAADGTATVTLSAENYHGPIQVLAMPPQGSTLFYVDPTNPASTVTIPSSMGLTSYVSDYITGAQITVPVTLWSSLADAAVLAYVRGNNRKYPTLHSLGQALLFTDHLFAEHIDPVRPAYALREAVPVSLTQPPARNLTDVVYAALPDVALNQLAHDVGVWAGLGSGGVITAPSLVALLQQDLLGDGQFDGLGAGGQQIQTPGSPPYALDANLLRVSLANALDEFIQSSRNMTGLTRTNLDNAGVYTAMSGDTSDLFGPLAPQPFDNAGPTISVAATYGTSSSAPVGAGKLVAGVVHLTVTASDPSGVQSVNVAVGGSNVPGTLVKTGSSATFTADYSTVSAGTADGALTFQVTASDVRSNGASSSYSVTVDNTPPAITVVNPAAATYYSAAVPVEATATDANGVASVVETANGLVDQDGSASRFLSSWSIPAGQPDGAAAFTFRACDVVQNCAASGVQGLVDRTPPAVSVVQAPPATTNASNVTFKVAAIDAGAGVGAAYAQTPGWPAVTGTFSAGAWTFTNVPLNEGANSISVWAVDRATPANGGVAGAITVSVLKDSLAPVPTVRTAASYYDERTMMVGAGVPAVYSWPAGTAKNAVQDGAVLYKAATRLSWSTQPTPAVLEGSNPDNLPFVQFGVPTGPVEAALSAATYSIAVNGGTPISGDLLAWKSSASTTTTLLFDLPLSANIVSALSTATGAVSLSISATFTDAAGNSGSAGPLTVTFHVIGAPLSVVEDSAYSTYSDPKSPFPYTVASGTYGTMWNAASPNFPGGAVRLVRYVISNPAPAPVAVSATLTGASWAALESWTRFRGPALSGFSYTVDGFNIYNPARYIVSCSGSYCSTPDISSYPCSNLQSNAVDTIAHQLGNTTTKWTCVQEAVSPPANATNSSATPGAAFYVGPQPSAGEVVAPSMDAGNTMYVVPAASGSQPGTLVLYVTRPVSAARSRPLQWNAITTNSRYEYQDYIVNPYLRQVSGGGPTGSITYYEYPAYKSGLYLGGASETLSGSVSFTTRGISGSTLVGEAANGSAATVTRTVAH